MRGIHHLSTIIFLAFFNLTHLLGFSDYFEPTFTSYLDIDLLIILLLYINMAPQLAWIGLGNMGRVSTFHT